jgi:hypothetical protein
MITTTKKISTLGHERERERERYCRYCVSANPRNNVERNALKCFLHGRVLVRCAAAEWDSAHVMCATPDALNVVSFLFFLPLRDIRRSVCMYVAVNEVGTVHLAVN